MDSGKPNNYEPSDDENDRPEKSSDGGGGGGSGGGGSSGGGRSYDCTYCKRGFTNAQALGGHMNIHRKEKAKAKHNQNSNKLETISKLSADHHQAFDSRYFSMASSDHQQEHFVGLGQPPQFNYHNYFPQSNPTNQHAYHHPYNYNYFQAPRREEEDHVDATLGLNIGTPHVDDDEEDDDDDDDNEVDLELRLGHHR